MNEISSHMVSGHVTIKWTKEKCQEESLKYKTKNDFRKNSNGCYHMSHRNGWIDEICSHMIKPKNDKIRCIYAYEFIDKSVYVGLTYDINIRKSKHFTDSRSTVYKYYNFIGTMPKLVQLTEYLPVDISKIKEEEYVKKYKNDGWNILNVTKTGSIGSDILFWTKEKCQVESLKYKTKKDFYKNNNSAYRSSIRNGWLDEITLHMKELIKPKNYWTKEKCEEMSKKCKNKYDFCKKYKSSYNKSYYNNWLNDFFKY